MPLKGEGVGHGVLPVPGNKWQLTSGDSWPRHRAHRQGLLLNRRHGFQPGAAMSGPSELSAVTKCTGTGRCNP